MPVHDDLGTRMKENYESRDSYKLTRRTPVIIRIDGKAFHTFTQGFEKPYDMMLMKCMQETMKYCCEHIEGCVFGYTQSDEISLLLVDYKKFTSNAWFDYKIQKICSISASLATLAFNRIFDKEVQELWSTPIKGEIAAPYLKAVNRGACFDARCFNIPKEEVCNYFYWRQIDATRNSIEMAGHAYFSTKELHKKSCNNIQDMLHEQKGINWNDYPTDCKRGSCCYKEYYLQTTLLDGQPTDSAQRTRWIIDKEIPFFNRERNFIEQWLTPEEE